MELDEEKLKKAMDLSKAKTIKQVLDRSLDALIAQARRESMSSLLGTGFFDGDLNKMRKRHERTGR